jgi:hypothetical protein
MYTVKKSNILVVINSKVKNKKFEKNRTFQKFVTSKSRVVVKGLKTDFVMIYLRILGYRYRRTRRAPCLAGIHKLERFLWCLNNRDNDFLDYLFTDETTIRFLEIPLYHVRRMSCYPNAIKSTGKYRLKMNVCGGISSCGATRFEV